MCVLLFVVGVYSALLFVLCFFRYVCFRWVLFSCCCVLFDGCCLSYVVGCMSSVVSWLCLLIVQVVIFWCFVCCLLLVVRRCGVRCLLFVVGVSWFVVCVVSFSAVRLHTSLC